MCRLFGFHSVIQSRVHASLLQADNALSSQSLRHPDGWGVVYYCEGVPHLIKSTERALDDQIFHQVSGIVSSQTVLAHLRKATQGKLNILNSHPFQYGKWVFAHNGNLKNFSSYREDLLNLIDPRLKRFVLGTTDSEIIFFLLLTEIKKRQCLSKDDLSITIQKEVVENLCQTICQFSGPLYDGADIAPKENHLTFLLSSGKILTGFHGGQELNYSTHKSLCSERDQCPHYNPSCENVSQNSQKINHLLFASEKLKGENQWSALKHGELCSVDENMRFHKERLKVDFAH